MQSPKRKRVDGAGGSDDALLCGTKTRSVQRAYGAAECGHQCATLIHGASYVRPKRRCPEAQADASSRSRLIEARDTWLEILSMIPSGKHAIRWLPPFDLLMRALDLGLDPAEAFRLRQMFMTCHADRARGGGREECRQFLIVLRAVAASFTETVDLSLGQGFAPATASAFQWSNAHTF